MKFSQKIIRMLLGRSAGPQSVSAQVGRSKSQWMNGLPIMRNAARSRLEERMFLSTIFTASRLEISITKSIKKYLTKTEKGVNKMGGVRGNRSRQVISNSPTT